ncbi:PSR [Symbiodinium natans]|uniref:PSR protein n=1 Tax=Symbiodinium natans TaxID=878477 RepID=A0A812KRJ7_9DINO|nr:PSR [Symbiodinium natans]
MQLLLAELVNTCLSVGMVPTCANLHNLKGPGQRPMANMANVANVANMANMANRVPAQSPLASGPGTDTARLMALDAEEKALMQEVLSLEQRAAAFGHKKVPQSPRESPPARSPGSRRRQLRPPQSREESAEEEAEVIDPTPPRPAPKGVAPPRAVDGRQPKVPPRPPRPGPRSP